MSDTKVLVPCRFSYAYVWKPQTNDDGVIKYSVKLLIDKKDFSTVKKIKKAMKAAEVTGAAVLKGKKNIQLPLHDGDEKEGDGSTEGMWILNAKSDQQPGIVDKNKEEIIDQREFYSGCYGYASINFFAYNKKGNVGVGVGLNNVMKTKDGPPLSGRGTAESDFSDLEIEDDENSDDEGSEFF
jgi:hypothetical protein